MAKEKTDQKKETKINKDIINLRMQKIFNPLKMWGSWVGAIIPILIVTFFPLQIGLPITYWWVDGDGISSITLWSEIVLCFLTGWGIHSLIRKREK